jgi:hypothetical protein
MADVAEEGFAAQMDSILMSLKVTFLSEDSSATFNVTSFES